MFYLVCLLTHDIFFSRNIIFYESFFPFTYSNKSVSSEPIPYNFSDPITHFNEILPHTNPTYITNVASANNMSMLTNNSHSHIELYIPFSNDLTIPTYYMHDSSNEDPVPKSLEHGISLPNAQIPHTSSTLSKRV